MSNQKMSLNSAVCEPLKRYEDIKAFIDNPPAWRSLCSELKDHSEDVIRNVDLLGNVPVEFPAIPTFCHSTAEAVEAPRTKASNVPKTLVCHDFANGYHDDCVLEGTVNHDAYTFYNWSGVDIFCYFSHHLITIPPLAWINVGHKHGVKVIGTVITERSDGVLFWDKVLRSETEWRDLASALVAIAKILKFDGWLLNIENKITNTAGLLQFVKYLHRSLHEELVAPELIWYDSVTVKGLLQYQNGLTHLNKAYFDACDGIFTNYSWSDGDVAASASMAGERRTDVYVGVDVWGRNFLGGGHFNTQTAVKIAHSHGCSLAIFAPGWTHEAMPDESSEPSEPKKPGKQDKPSEQYEQFLLRDKALWSSLWPYLNTKLPKQLPFTTSFCRGQGRKRWSYGEVINPSPWFNLRDMQYQPNANLGPHGYDLLLDKPLYHFDKQNAITNVKREVSNQQENDKESGKLETEFVTENDDKEQQRGWTEQKQVQNQIDIEQNVVGLEQKQDEVEQNELRLEQKEIGLELNDIKLEPKELKLEQKELKLEQKELKLEQKELKLEQKELKLEQKELKLEQKVFGLEQNQVTSNSVGNRNASRIDQTVQTKTDHKQNVEYILKSNRDEGCLQIYYPDSFNGGSCLKVNPQSGGVVRLFHCDFTCKGDVIVCVVTKNLPGHDQYLNIHLNCLDHNSRNIRVVLKGHKLPPKVRELTGVVLNPPIEVASVEFQTLREYLSTKKSDINVAVENVYGWNVRYHQINLENHRILSINCQTELKTGPILLGHFAICHRA